VEHIKFPLTPEVMNIIMDMIIECNRDEYPAEISKRHGWEPVITEKENYMDKNKIRKVKDWDQTLRNNIAEMDTEGQFRIVFEFLYERVWSNPSGIIAKLEKL
jgi:hypothetical protein